MPQPQSDPTVQSRRKVRDDVAYWLPMLVFLLLTSAGGYLPRLYPIIYAVKTATAALLLAVLWPNFTRVRWNHWWLGVIVGVIGVLQWVPMQLWLQANFAFFKSSPDVFNPKQEIAGPALLYAFYAVRIAGAVLVVPVMEELFWRDFLWRTILAPNDFKLARVGEWGWAPFLIVCGAFATVHGNWWLTSIVWAVMIAGLLLYTKSIGACIIAHAVTNLLLAGYVLWTEDWAFW